MIEFIETQVYGDAARMRRRHTKSRSGCESCKKRKIKCDEKLPCHGCVSRNYQCSLSTVAKKCRVIQGTAQADNHVNGANLTKSFELTTQPCPINLSHIYLFHHFERVVSKLLVLDTPIWVDHVVSISLKNEIVMQAVFCMSAAHLRYLEPQKLEYREAEIQNLSCALGGLAEALQSPIAPENVDAICSCSMLLYHHAWCSTTQDKSVSPADYYYGLESLIPLAKGMKSVMFASLEHITSAWYEVAAYRPIIPIKAVSNHTMIPSQIEQDFQNQYDLLASNRGPLLCRAEIYMAECKRLIPVLSALKLRQQGADISHIQSDLSRYLFTYPVLFRSEFLEAMREGDICIQIVLAHFYVAVSTLMPNKFWWAHRRMEYLLEGIDGEFMQNAFATMGIETSSALK